MEELDIDVELLISLVQHRPVLWDKSLESYRSRAGTTAAWREVCNHLNPDFEYMSDEAKNKYGKMLSMKWTNVRDRYNKYLKKLQEKNSGYRRKSFKKYVYSDQMNFLLKNNVKKGTVSSTETEREETGNSENLFDNSPSNKKHIQAFVSPIPSSLGNMKRPRTGVPDTEKYIMHKLQQPEDRHVSFFKSILPTLQKFDDNETLLFQGEVIRMIQDIHRSRITNQCCPHPCVSQFGSLEERILRHAPPPSSGHGHPWNPATPQENTTSTSTPAVGSPASSSPQSIVSYSDHTENLDSDIS
ncbi:uncharacterized protein LOC143034896 isoform X2 [Oratosquilla oratoria]|uniref:uncharacterized protein LOC143034896 isoform X2 n=1 Tax=Oratosquilla oratoria TaxID=337810 RepID=UPI003F7619B8